MRNTNDGHNDQSFLTVKEINAGFNEQLGSLGINRIKAEDGFDNASTAIALYIVA